MGWKLDDERPIYIQIVEKISSDIASGIYSAGDKLPSVREFALEAAVNPNTMQKALTELERIGLVYSKRTNGRYITDNEQLIQEYKSRLAKNETGNYLIRMNQLGFNKEQTLQYVQNCETSINEEDKSCNL